MGVCFVTYMAEFLPVTRTKIVVPRRRADLLSRRRLLELIDELLENRLIIIAAPAGYGKTSLLVDFASSSPWPVCWYALDALDGDPYRFIAHFISAIQLRFPAFGKTCLAALQSMGQENLNLDVLVSLIINDAYESITEHFLLVLDDFHLVETSQEVVYFVNRFIQDADENCHLALCSRMLLTLPDLPLMVARSQVGGLSFDELTFQADEIQTLLLQNYNLTLTPEEASELAHETEGWVTGLLLSTQLMGKTIANRLRVARVSGVGLYDYLASQVLAQQTPDVQDFLLRTALLDEFDEALCQEVIGGALGVRSNWRALMGMVMRHNLFVLPVGEDGLTLRYHHLFLDFLRDRAQRERPEEALLIQKRLAEVYVVREDWERAYAIYQRLGDTQSIVRLVEQAGSAMIFQGRLVTLSEWLNSLPADLLSRHPSLLSLQGAVVGGRGETARALEYLDQAVSALRKVDQPLQLALALVRRCTAFRLLGQYRQASQDADEALSLFAGLNQLTGASSQSAVVYADTLQSKGIVLYSMGRLQEALELLEKALEVYQSLNDTNTAAKVWMEIGMVERTLGQFDAAEESYKHSLEGYQAAGNLVLQANLFNNLGVLQHYMSDYVAATTSLEKAVQYARLGGAPRLEAYALASIGDLYLELDAVQEAREAYLRSREISQRITEGYLLFYLNLAEARLELARGDADRAAVQLDAARASAAERGSGYELNTCLLDEARLLLLRGDTFAALDTAQSALNFFLEEEYQGEIPRARLFVLMTALACGAHEPAAEQAAELQLLLQDNQVRKLLLSAGWEMRAQLADQSEAASKRAASKAAARAENGGTKVKTGPLIDPSLLASLMDLVTRHETSIPTLRRQIRRHAIIVPFAPPKMVIRALGRVQVRVSDHVVTSSEWQVQTARDLFMLLLAHPEGLTKEQIGEIFWPDSTISELKLRFKNTIYRLRHAAGKDAILFEGESLYLFNRSMDYEYDVELFLKELALVDKSKSNAERMEHLRAAAKLYRGPYLPDVDATWAFVERERLAQLYIDALLRLAGCELEERDYAAVLETCQVVFKEDRCQEEAHRLAMRAHAAMGNRHLVIRQYETCVQALEEELDAPPSSQTQDLYDLLTE